MNFAAAAIRFNKHFNELWSLLCVDQNLKRLETAIDLYTEFKKSCDLPILVFNTRAPVTFANSSYCRNVRECLQAIDGCLQEFALIGFISTTDYCEKKGQLDNLAALYVTTVIYHNC